ncbi:MAG: PqqD family protein [Rhodothermales bacterium]|nr:PqqD family protein [Rhodothermales bacterium]
MIAEAEMISEKAYIIVSKDLLSSRLGDEIVILSVNGGKYYGLNPLAAFVWGLLADPVKFNDLKMAVLQEYEVPEDKCVADLNKLIVDLQKEGLVSIAEENPVTS